MAQLKTKQVVGNTSGSVIFIGSDGTLSEDNSNLFWDSGNTRLGIGTTGSSLTSTGSVSKLIISDSFTDTGFNATIASEVNYNPSANNTSWIRGSSFAIQKNGSNNTNQLIGTSTYVRNNGGGDITHITGVDGFIWNTASTTTISNFYSFRASPQTQGSGTITNYGGLLVTYGQQSAGTINNMYGVYVSSPAASVATIDTAYGIRIGSNGEATTSWGIYQEGSSTGNYFQGDVRIGTSTRAATDTALTIRGSGTTDATNLITLEGSSGGDNFVMQDNGQMAWGIGTNASINSSFGLYATQSGYAFGYGFYASNSASAGVTVQMQGTTRTGLSIGQQGNPSGGNSIGLLSRIIGNASVNNYGVNGLARNGSSINYGIFGQVAGGATVTPSVRSAGIAGRSLTNVNDLTYGGYFTTANEFGGVRTQDLIAVFGSAGNATVASGSTSVAIGAQFRTSTASGGGGAAVNGNMALNIPLTSNDGNVVIGADAVGSNASMLELTGNFEIISGQMFINPVTDTVSTNAVTVDWDSSNHTEIDLQPATGTVTVTLSNPTAGAWYAIKVIQGTGGHNITWPGTVLWPGGTAPTITGTDDAIDLIRLYYDGTNYLATYDQDFQ